MNNNWNTKTLLEAVGLTALIAIFTIMGFYIPAGMLLMVFLCSVTLVVLIVRTNERVVVPVVIVIYALIFFVTGDAFTSAIIVSSFGFSGLALGWGFKRRKDFRSLFILSSSAYLLTLLLAFFLSNLVHNINLINVFILDPMEQFFIQLEKEAENVAQILGTSFISAAELAQLKNTISFFVPGFLLLVSSFFGYITLMLSKSVLNGMKYDYKYLPMFSQLKVGKATVSVFVLSFLLSIIITDSVISAALLNITLILSMVLGLCGLSVIDFFIKRYGIPGIVRIIIYIIGFVITMLVGLLIPIIHPSNILTLLSLADSIFDFRKIGHKGENHGK